MLRITITRLMIQPIVILYLLPLPSLSFARYAPRRFLPSRDTPSHPQAPLPPPLSGPIPDDRENGPATREASGTARSGRPAACPTGGESAGSRRSIPPDPAASSPCTAPGQPAVHP